MPFNQRIQIQHLDDQPWPPLPGSFSERINQFKLTRQWQLPLQGIEFLPYVPEHATVVLVRHPDGQLWPFTADLGRENVELTPPAPVFRQLTTLSLSDDTFQWFGLNWHDLGYRHNYLGSVGSPQRCLNYKAAVYHLALSSYGLAKLQQVSRSDGQTLEEVDLTMTSDLRQPFNARCRRILTHYLPQETFVQQPAMQAAAE